MMTTHQNNQPSEDENKDHDSGGEWSHLLFEALDVHGRGEVELSDISAVLSRSGLHNDDPRLVPFYEHFNCLTNSDQHTVNRFQFEELANLAGLLFSNALRGQLAIPDFSTFGGAIDEMYHVALENSSGAQADYIPPLREVNPDQLGIAIITVDGQTYIQGDAEIDFSIQSTCKPFNYCFAVEELGADKVHQHIGSEPSGRPFNAQALQTDSRPHNPMINAGAIMSAALIRSGMPVHRRLEHVRAFWSKLTGGHSPRFNAWMAKEEGRTGDNNRALAYMMKAQHVFPKGEDASDHEIRDALELYFSTCSLELNCREMALAASTLANGGVCPTTQERVFESSTVRHCLSLMQMCGMYDYSGEFCFRIGVPAKSGVGGAVILAVPGLMGICIWSPRFDRIGNSVRGVEIATRLTERYALHLYDGISAKRDRLDPRVPPIQAEAVRRNRAIWAASANDVWTLRQLYEAGFNFNLGDYDHRTPLHIAAAEGHLEAAQFLIDHEAQVNQHDRWGQTPVNDALRGNYHELQSLLQAHGGEQSEGVFPHTETTLSNYICGDPDLTAELIWSAYLGDLINLQRLFALGHPVNLRDYDGRTPLHLAASEGHVEVCAFLISHGHSTQLTDRWGSTAADDAQRHGYNIDLLSV
jgi:glutaminase